MDSFPFSLPCLLLKMSQNQTMLHSHQIKVTSHQSTRAPERYFFAGVMVTGALVTWFIFHTSFLLYLICSISFRCSSYLLSLLPLGNRSYLQVLARLRAGD